VSTDGGIQAWRWRQYVPPKHWYTARRPHDAATQKTTIYIEHILGNSMWGCDVTWAELN
jgi:hypothetical protein